MVGIPAVDKVGYFCLLVVSHHDVNAFDVGYLLAVQLGIASRHHHHGIRVSARQFSDFLSAFLVSQFRHRASVDHANVGRLARLHRLCTTVGEKLADGRSLGKVKFASQRVECHLLIVKSCIVYHLSTKIVQAERRAKQTCLILHIRGAAYLMFSPAFSAVRFRKSRRYCLLRSSAIKSLMIYVSLIR